MRFYYKNPQEGQHKAGIKFNWKTILNCFKNLTNIQPIGELKNKKANN